MNDEKAKAQKERSKQAKAKAKGGELVPLDYSFLDKEDF